MSVQVQQWQKERQEKKEKAKKKTVMMTLVCNPFRLKASGRSLLLLFCTTPSLSYSFCFLIYIHILSRDIVTVDGVWIYD
jgi:hypothetical protein